MSGATEEWKHGCAAKRSRIDAQEHSEGTGGTMEAEQSNLQDRICHRGHVVSLKTGTGKVYTAKGYKPRMQCLPCKVEYKKDLKRLGLTGRRKA